ncbi:MAG: SLC13 family permease [Nitrospirota bacterium]
MITALVIFLITYLFIGLRQIPRIHIDRPAGALVGGVLMIITGVLTLDQAFAAIDLHTLLLLLGMMIITVYLRIAGFFELMADRILSLSKTPFQLLVFVTISSGILSALFVNDTICLLYTPIILAMTAQLSVNPVPYLLALATASNIGGAMTVTGNPQNMLIGIYSNIPYLSFLGALFPVTIIGFAVSIMVIRFAYRRDIVDEPFCDSLAMPHYEVNRPLLMRSLAVCAGVLAAFSLGYPYSLTAAAGAVSLMLIGGVRTERVLEGVDWTLLLFFSGLFVVMHGVEVSGLAGTVIGRAGDLSALSPAGRIAGLSVVSAVLSNVVSNVPAVMLLKPFVESLGGDRVAWLALAMSSTLAGNLTLIGSVANLIVVQQARKQVEIGFLEHFRVGALITIITIAAGIVILVVEVRIAQGAEPAPVARSAKEMTITVTPAGPDRVARVYRVALLCDSDAKQRQGLQGFRQLAADEAALFPYEKPAEVTFWMGSVSYPLDIIYVVSGGTVTRVYRDCRPSRSDVYPSGSAVRWVIETLAGSGIEEGDRISIGR